MADELEMDALFEGTHVAPLDADSVPDGNQAHYCPSCDEPLVNLYCGNCGQKNDDFRRPLWRLGKEAVVSLTAVENRIWRTWATLLLKPGKVAREFANGRREHWSSPVRVYIFTSIFLFGFMELSGTMFFALQAKVEARDGVDKPRAEWTVDDVTWKISSHWFPTQSEVDAWNADVDFDLLRAKLGNGSDDEVADADGSDAADATLRARIDEARPEMDGLAEADVAVFRERMAALKATLPTEDDGSREIIDDAISDLEARLAPDDADDVRITREDGSFEITVAPGETRRIDEAQLRQFLIDYIRNPAIGNNILNKWLPRIIFVMMPLTMFIGAMFIRGRRRKRMFGPRDPDAQPALLYDHLVHAAYIHAVAYFVLLIALLAMRYTPIGGAAAGLSVMGYMALHLPVSLRRMFGRGWIKTIWTSYGVSTIHFLIVLTLTSVAIVMGLSDHFATLR